MKNLHGIRAELKRSRDFSRQKVGTAVSSQGRFLNMLFSAEKGSMATGLRVEDKLDGATNFGAWKERMIFLLQDNELWDIVENTTTHLVVVLNIVTNLMRTLQSSRFLGGPIFYLVFKNGATGSTPSPFRWFFYILNFLIHNVSKLFF